MQKVIWIDLDEVLAETLDYCLFFHNYKINWKSIKREDVKDYYIYNMSKYNISLEQGIQWFRDGLSSDIWRYNIKPVQWAIDYIKQLKSKWYILKIITARRAELYTDYTKNWIDKYYPNIFDEIIFSSHFDKTKQKSKSQICEENKIKVCLLEKPWNKQKWLNHKNIICVKSWEEILKIIQILWISF